LECVCAWCIEVSDVDGEQSTTLLEEPGVDRRRRTAALLLAAGPAGEGRASARLVGLEGELTIGRGDLGGEGDRLALRDSMLSRAHLRVTPRARGFDVVDAGSLNGTYVDGRRVTSPIRLSDGSIVSFGRHAAVFRRVTPVEAEAIRADRQAPFGPVSTLSPTLAMGLAKLRSLARSNAALLLVGETGVGKKTYARAAHQLSARKGPFVSLDCAALPASRLEGELFGAARSGAASRGLLAAADGGTLLLEEVGQLPEAAQIRIFRFLEGRSEGRAPPLDVRVIATTSTSTSTGDVPLRPELLARLGADPVQIPPLRHRPEDLGCLLAHFGGDALREVDAAAFRALCLYAWPLNVAELETCIRRALTLCPDGHLRVEQLPAVVGGSLTRGAPVTAGRRTPRAAPGRGELERLLREHRGNVAGVARALDRQWNVVWRWLVRHELQPSRFRG
jgi:DNA-binding NtrC family response regulator